MEETIDILDNPEDLNEQESTGVKLLDEDEELKPEPVGSFIDKSLLIDSPVEMIITGLGINRWNKYVLFGSVSNEDRSLAINKTNYNWLVDNLGKKVKNWKGKIVKVVGLPWEGDIEGKQTTGTTLSFSVKDAVV